MSEIVKLRTRAEIDEAAAAWIWRMEGGPAGGADPEAFEAWLRQDPRHRRAVEELSKVWQTLDGIAASPMAAFPEVPAAEAIQRGKRPSRRSLWFAAAAAAAAAGLAVSLMMGRGNETQVLQTAVGQHRNVVLADGSVVSLNTNTVVETDFGRQVRAIYLRKGEAHFEVAHDRSRPFLVHAGDAVVRAVGTEFEVRLRADQHVDVLVNEGRVEVEPYVPDTRSAVAVVPEKSRPVTTARAVSAGQELSTAATNYAVVPVSPEQLSSELAWREGAVVFDSEPLSEAIAEIQRYTDARIVISDASIATLPVGGRFKTDDLQGFLNGLETALPITIRRTDSGVIFIDPRRR
jgi:transmembrane sensor